MSELAFMENYKIIRARIEAQGVAFMKAKIKTLDDREEKQELQVDKPVPVTLYRTIYWNPIGPLISEPGVVDFIYGVNCRKQNINARLTMAAILHEVAFYFSVSKNDLMGHRRHKLVGWPRQVFMWRCRHETLRSLPEIGRFIGGRDHTTVLHSVRKIDALLAAGKITRAEIGAPEAGAE
jgi:hypothetical protein